jgi:hypothetical protein
VMCLAEDETLTHALTTCSHAQRFWEEVRKILDLKLPRLRNRTWSRDILCDQRFSEKQRVQTISIIYSIWSSRNQWAHDGRGVTHINL